MDVSVLLPWKDRPEISLTLRHNAAHFAAIGAEVVLINGGGPTERLLELIDSIGYARLRVVDLPGVRHFNKSECLNVGASLCSGRYIFAMDVDILLSPGFFDQVLPPIRQNDGFVTVLHVAESDASVHPDRFNPRSFIRSNTVRTEFTCEDGRSAAVLFRVDRDGVRNGAGLILVGREPLLAVGGFNSALKGWGFEDYDFHIRLQLALGLTHWERGHVTHLSHPKAKNGTLSNAVNAELARANYERGHFVGTLPEDWTRWRHALREIPRTGA